MAIDKRRPQDFASLLRSARDALRGTWEERCMEDILSGCLHRCAAGDFAEGVALIASHGGDLDKRRGPFGLTALHVAAENGCVEVVAALLAAGADERILDGGASLAKDLARNKECVEMLEAFGEARELGAAVRMAPAPSHGSTRI